MPIKLRTLSPATRIAIIGSLLSLTAGTLLPNWRMAGEGLCITAVVAFTLSRPAIRTAAERLPSSMAILATILITLMLSGQLAGKGKGTFPFTPWTMYSTSGYAKRVNYYEFIGFRPNGTEVFFIPRSGGMILMHNEMEALLRDSRDERRPLDKRRISWDTFCGYATIALETYRRENPKDTIVGFRMLQKEVVLEEPWPTTTTTLVEWRPGDPFK